LLRAAFLRRHPERAVSMPQTCGECNGLYADFSQADDSPACGRSCFAALSASSSGASQEGNQRASGIDYVLAGQFRRAVGIAGDRRREDGRVLLPGALHAVGLHQLNA